MVFPFLGINLMKQEERKFYIHWDTVCEIWTSVLQKSLKVTHVELYMNRKRYDGLLTSPNHRRCLSPPGYVQSHLEETIGYDWDRGPPKYLLDPSILTYWLHGYNHINVQVFVL